MSNGSSVEPPRSHNQQRWIEILCNLDVLQRRKIEPGPGNGNLAFESDVSILIIIDLYVTIDCRKVLRARERVKVPCPKNKIRFNPE